MYNAVTCMRGDVHAVPSENPEPSAKPYDKKVVELN